MRERDTAVKSNNKNRYHRVLAQLGSIGIVFALWVPSSFAGEEVDPWSLDEAEDEVISSTRYYYDLYGSTGLTVVGQGPKMDSSGPTFGAAPSFGFRLSGIELEDETRLFSSVNVELRGGIGGGAINGKGSSLAIGSSHFQYSLGRVYPGKGKCDRLLNGGTQLAFTVAEPTGERVSEAEAAAHRAILVGESPIVQMQAGWVCEREGQAIVILPSVGLNFDLLHLNEFRVGSGLQVSLWNSKVGSFLSEVNVGTGFLGEADARVTGRVDGTLWLWSRPLKTGESTHSDLPRIKSGLGLDIRVANQPGQLGVDSKGDPILTGRRVTAIQGEIAFRRAF